MTQAHVEALEGGFAAYAKGDFAGMLTLFAPDAVCRRWPPLPDPGTYRGPAGFAELVNDWIKGFKDFETGVNEYIDVDEEQVISRVFQRAVGAESGARVDAEFWFVWRLEDSAVKRLDIYMTEEQARDAARSHER